MRKAKLVKRAEITILGTVALALFCSTHVPEFLSTLDTAVSTDPTVYSASAAAPYVEHSSTVAAPILPAEASPVVENTASEMVPDVVASSTPETTITVTPIEETYTETDPSLPDSQ